MPSAQTYILNMVLAFIPDLLICWAVMNVTDRGWSGFFLILLALQMIYLFFWLKTALWSWLLFWIYGRDQMVLYLEKFFFKLAFQSRIDLDDYLNDIVAHDELDCDTRLRAALVACGVRAQAAMSLGMRTRL
jgi:hypothetical protein